MNYYVLYMRPYTETIRTGPCFGNLPMAQCNLEAPEEGLVSDRDQGFPAAKLPAVEERLEKAAPEIAQELRRAPTARRGVATLLRQGASTILTAMMRI